MTRPAAIYYGWPSEVNGAGGDPLSAAAALAGFDRVVLGEANVLPEGDPRAPDVVSFLSAVGVQVLGYVNVGLVGAESSRAMSELSRRLSAWARLGAGGVLLDCAGKDFGVTPRRLRAAVHRAHDSGLDVVANAWEPGDVLGEGSPLGPGDGYLAESWIVRDGVPLAPESYRAKIECVERARTDRRLEVMLSSTVLDPAGASSIAERAVDLWVACGANPPDWVTVGDPLYGAADNRIIPLDPTWRVGEQQHGAGRSATRAPSRGRGEGTVSLRRARRRR